jgi:hypothetical protein
MNRKLFSRVIDTVGMDKPVMGLKIEAWGDNWFDGDDYMGRAYTNQNSEYKIKYFVLG